MLYDGNTEDNDKENFFPNIKSNYKEIIGKEINDKNNTLLNLKEYENEKTYLYISLIKAVLFIVLIIIILVSYHIKKKPEIIEKEDKINKS